MTRLHYYNYKLAISSILCLLSFVQLKAQEEKQAKDWKSHIRNLPSRTRYFNKEKGQNIIKVETSEITQNEALSPSPLVRFLLSENNQTKGASSLLSTSLSLPLRFQNISIKELSQSKQILCVDTCFKLNYLPKKEEHKPISEATEKVLQKWEIENALYNTTINYLQTKYINRFTFTKLEEDNKQTRFRLEQEKQSLPQLASKKVQNDGMQDIIQTLQITKFEKRHWIPSFESSIQLSQNYVSENWHKGGQSNLNLHTRTYFKLEYRSDNGKIIWNNEIEDKLGLYSDQNQVNGNGYRISSDLLRLRSNYGLKAMGRWYYTIDGELKTQLFNTYQNKENKQILQSAFLAPLHFNAGLGMKYSYAKAGKVYGSKFSFSTNIAPLSFTYKKSFRDDIELSRHGFSPDKMSDYSIGSTIKAQIDWQFNMDISWTSRLYFNTSYSHIETEWENTLNMKIGRYFSTRLNLHLRYDDSVPPQNNWQRYLQINELLSFGFNYRL